MKPASNPGWFIHRVQHDEWAEIRRYLGLAVVSKSRAVNDTPRNKEDTPATLTAGTPHLKESQGRRTPRPGT